MSTAPSTEETLKKLGMTEEELAKFAEGARFLFGDAPAAPESPPEDVTIRAR